jgi:hypothetical protein
MQSTSLVRAIVPPEPAFAIRSNYGFAMIGIVEKGGAAMERIAIVANLKPGTEERARKLLEGGPPFDVATAGATRHVVYASTSDVVFVFEGHGLERRLHGIVSAPFESALTSALDQWRDVVDGPARIARAVYAWDAGAEAPSPSTPDEQTTRPAQ